MVRILAVFGALLALGSGTPAKAQSFDDAVRGNAALAFKLCLSGGNDMEAWAQTFYAAGFTGRVDRSTTNSDTTHYLSAPADTVQVELYYGEQPDYCSVTTQHMGVTEAAKVLDLVVPQLYPGYTRQHNPGGCPAYIDPTNPIGHIVGVLPLSDATGCPDDGTSRFYSSYRV